MGPRPQLLVAALTVAQPFAAQPVEPIAFAAPSVDAADVAAVVEVLRSGWLTTGEECAKLESELSAYLGVSHVVAVSSGTAALEISMASLGLTPGARVGVPTWTFVASALAPVHHGARPVLLDVDPDTLNVSPDALAAALEVGLQAVVAVHFGGIPLDREVHRLCADAGVPVIEDAAHALGATDYRGPVAGQGSVSACFSFYATKNLTCGEGGALATEDSELAEFARSFRLHGLSHDAWARYRPEGRAQYDLLAAGIKANLSDVLAALARSQLARFSAMQTARRSLVLRYRYNLAGIDGLQLVPSGMVDGSADHLMVVLLPEGVSRDDVIDRFQAEGIGTSVHFQPLHQFRWFRRRADIGPGGVATADELAPRALSLPLHPGLRPDQVDRVCAVLQGALGP